MPAGRGSSRPATRPLSVITESSRAIPSEEDVTLVAVQGCVHVRVQDAEGLTESAQTYCHPSEETSGHYLASFVKTIDRRAFVRLASIQFEYKTQYNTFLFNAMVPTDLVTFGGAYDLPLRVEDTIRDAPGLIKSTRRPLLKGQILGS